MIAITVMILVFVAAVKLTNVRYPLNIVITRSLLGMFWSAFITLMLISTTTPDYHSRVHHFRLVFGFLLTAYTYYAAVNLFVPYLKQRRENRRFAKTIADEIWPTIRFPDGKPDAEPHD